MPRESTMRSDPIIQWIEYLLSPTKITGCTGLNAILVQRLLFLLVTLCTQMGANLSSAKSNTCTSPSPVATARTVLLYGAQATSSTSQPTSISSNGLLEKFLKPSFTFWAKDCLQVTDTLVVTDEYYKFQTCCPLRRSIGKMLFKHKNKPLATVKSYLYSNPTFTLLSLHSF